MNHEKKKWTISLSEKQDKILKKEILNGNFKNKTDLLMKGIKSLFDKKDESKKDESNKEKIININVSDEITLSRLIDLETLINVDINQMLYEHENFQSEIQKYFNKKKEIQMKINLKMNEFNPSNNQKQKTTSIKFIENRTKFIENRTKIMNRKPKKDEVLRRQIT